MDNLKELNKDLLEPGNLVMRPLVGSNERDAMFARLQEIILDGLRHGFFDCSITCELVKDRKRRVVIKAGKSHQFTIKEEELQN